MLEALDHPITFAVAITFVVFPLAAIFAWFFKATNMPGAAALYGG